MELAHEAGEAFTFSAYEFHDDDVSLVEGKAGFCLLDEG
jgi:hypothetical protein